MEWSKHWQSYRTDWPVATAEKVSRVCLASLVAVDMKPQEGINREEAEEGSGGSGSSHHGGRQ